MNRIMAVTLLALSLVFAASARAAIPTVYIAQTAQGSGAGDSCANARAVSFFNTSGNWGSGTAQIGPGTTVHLCGTFTSQLTAQGNGASGNPITVLFEAGAKISLPVCDSSNGCLSVAGRSYVVVDGGSNGVIENTANGSGLAHKQKSIGILLNSFSNGEIKNLTIQNIYVHSSASDTTDLDPPDGGIVGAALNNVAIHDNTIHDCHWCINYQFGSSASGLSIYNNNIYNTDHGIAVGGYGGGTVTTTKIYGNHIHDYVNWDTTASVYHHDGIHVYTNGGSTVDGIDIYNNLFDGDVGAHQLTAHIYLERDGNDVKNGRVFNNIALPSPNNRPNFGIFAFGSSPGHQIYNNTIGCGSTSGNVYGMLFEGSTALVKNNVLYNCYSGIGYYSANPSLTLDYNLYSGNSDVGYYIYSATDFATLSAWRSATGQESHSQTGSSNLDSTGHPQSGSAAIGVGANLTSLGIAALNTDRAGVARPASGAWDAGAYQSGSTPPSSTITGVTASCTPLSVQAGQTSQCSAVVSGVGSYSSVVTWGASSGSISAAGLFTAPSSAGSVSITATSAQDSSKSGSTTLAVTSTPPPASTITAVAGLCNPASIQVSQTSQCSATVTGTGAYSSAVTWTASAGTISSAGVLTAPNTSGSVTVTATSVQDSGKSGSATVTVTAAPPASTLAITQLVRYSYQNYSYVSASWSDTPGMSVTFTLKSASGSTLRSGSSTSSHIIWIGATPRLPLTLKVCDSVGCKSQTVN
jgi:hypothetical protein